MYGTTQSGVICMNKRINGLSYLHPFLREEIEIYKVKKLAGGYVMK